MHESGSGPHAKSGDVRFTTATGRIADIRPPRLRPSSDNVRASRRDGARDRRLDASRHRRAKFPQRLPDALSRSNLSAFSFFLAAYQASSDTLSPRKSVFGSGGGG